MKGGNTSAALDGAKEEAPKAIENKAAPKAEAKAEPVKEPVKREKKEAAPKDISEALDDWAN